MMVSIDVRTFVLRIIAQKKSGFQYHNRRDLVGNLSEFSRDFVGALISYGCAWIVAYKKSGFQYRTRPYLVRTTSVFSREKVGTSGCG